MSTFRKLFLLLACVCVPAAAQVSVGDSLALVDLYRSTNGDQWQNKSNWLTSAPVGTWYGVQVSNDRVIALNFYWGNNLQGPLPSSIGSLTGLRQLMLGGNRITSIPPEIGNLQELQSLDLSSNQLRRIPSSLARLTNLTLLNLSQNDILELPEQMGALTNLRQLILEHNRITRLPSSIGNLVGLTSLNAMNNLLDWIPDEIANLRSLTHLYLGGNRLTQLPLPVCSLDSLQLLWLYSNQLTSLPFEIGNLRKLVNLHLQGNQLLTLPASIGNLTLLQNLHLADNNLRSLPQEIGNLTRLRSFRAYNNTLDSIPSTIGNLTGLVDIWLQRNNLVTLPASIGSLTNLTHLYFDDNRLTDVPQFICNLPRLVLLSLRNNNLTGPVPECISRFTELGWLFLEQNKFNYLPSFAGASRLRVFSVYMNQLSFADLERNIGLPFTSFTYAPQDSFGRRVDTTVRAGASMVLDARTAGSRNHYQWTKNGVAIAGADSALLRLQAVDTTHAGTYICKVTSDSVPILELYTRLFRIRVDGTVGVHHAEEIPTRFSLEQNYPNPFNPTTTIRFSVGTHGRASLRVFDLLGREVATLVDEVMQPGKNEVKFDAHNLASGVYLYRLQAGRYVAVKKLVLAK